MRGVRKIYLNREDDFNHQFSYLYPTLVADLLENWHLPLTDFMQRVQTYYGQPTRLKLDRDSVITRQTLRVAEWHLYDSSRLGIYKTQDTLRAVDLSLVYKLSDVNIVPTQKLTKKEYYPFDSTYTHKRGDKLYEGSNHLGNVLVTFSDKRLATCTEGQVHYQADVRSATDYAAFGALLDDRQWYSGLDSGEYRYGFGGHEKVKELSSNGNYYDMGQRFYNPRLGVSNSIDPNFHIYVGLSPYHFSANNPIVFYDPDGCDGIRNAANSTITAQVIFIYDPVNISAVDAIQFENYARTNIQSVWGSQTFNGQLVNVTNVTTRTMTQEQYDLAVSNGLISFDGQTNVITLSSSGRSSVNSDLRTGVWNINNRGNTAAHEFGHLLGLSDRYQYLQGFTTLTGVENQWITVLLPQQQANNDPTYNPYDNLYSTNTSSITNQQLNFVFNASNGSEEGIQNFTFLGNPRSLGTLNWNSRNNGLQSSTFVLGLGNNGNLMTDNTRLRLTSIMGYLSSGLIYSLNSDNYAALLRNQGVLGELLIKHQSGNVNDRFSSGTQTIPRLQLPYD